MEILGRNAIRTAIFLLICFLSVHTFGQPFERMFVPMVKNNETLTNALTGGLNAPQFNAVDFNQDGKKDLVVFDREGNVLLPFLNKGNQGEINYSFAPAFINNFPALNSWMLLRDYNGDGIEDIFCYPSFLGISGVEVYKGFVLNGEVGYEKVTFPNEQFDLLYFNLTSGGRTQLYVSSIDIPDVNDIDGDGDLDILTFNSLGGKIEYYRNLSVENGYGLDTLLFRLEEDCWGGLYESGNTPFLDLSPEKGKCAVNFQDPTVQNRHTGSTVLTIDVDNDCAREIFLGDLSFDHLVMGINRGDCSEAWINAQDTFFPSYDLSVNLPSFPAAYYLDVNNDGKRDFIAARNTGNGGVDVETAWYYENVGTDEIPEFEFIQSDFLGETMIDLGTYSHPTFADVNGDGFQDLIIGIDGIYGNLGNSTDARLHLYLQRRNGNQISFELVDENWLNFRRYTQAGGNSPGQFGFSPTFGDLDNDNDLDLVVGTGDGILIVGINTAGPGQAMNFPNLIFKYKDIDVGTNASPAIFDVNEDGLNDLIIGEQNAILNYIQNIGTSGNPDFISTPNTSPNTDRFGKIDLREFGIPSAYGNPTVLDFPDRNWLVIGKELGGLRLFDMVTDPTAVYEEVDSNFAKIHEGERTHAAFADFDDDGVLEMVVGNSRGGIALYKTIYQTNGDLVNTRNPLVDRDLLVYPNPASNTLHLDGIAGNEKTVLSIFDGLGRLVVRQEEYDGGPIEVGQLQPGVYQLVLEIDGKLKGASWVKE